MAKLISIQANNNSNTLTVHLQVKWWSPRLWWAVLRG
jgi:hypothetical protein